MLTEDSISWSIEKGTYLFLSQWIIYNDIICAINRYLNRIKIRNPELKNCQMIRVYCAIEINEKQFIKWEEFENYIQWGIGKLRAVCLTERYMGGGIIPGVLLLPGCLYSVWSQPAASMNLWTCTIEMFLKW